MLTVQFFFPLCHMPCNIQRHDRNTFFMDHSGMDLLRCQLAVNDDDSLVMSSDHAFRSYFMIEKDRPLQDRRSFSYPVLWRAVGKRGLL